MAGRFYCLIVLCVSSIYYASFASASSLCPIQQFPFLERLRSRCSVFISPSSILEVDGESFEKSLSSLRRQSYVSVLLFASWCPFSKSVHPTFNTLSSMFPQIKHLAVEESSVMPSLFSRYGVRSLPCIIIVSEKSRIHYRGSKRVSSLVSFYKRVTGLEPVDEFPENQLTNSNSPYPQHWWQWTSMEMPRHEPYLLFSLLFLSLRAFTYFFPGVLSHLKTIFYSFIRRLNFDVYGETRQLIERAIYMIDAKGVWNKLRISKVSNFQRGAKNAGVWASSLTSVSLGESSSTKVYPS